MWLRAFFSNLLNCNTVEASFNNLPFDFSFANLQWYGDGNAKLPSCSGDTTPPSIPTGLTATAVSANQINLAWNASTDNVGVTGYKIYGGGNLLKSVTGLSTSDIGLSPNTQYCYKVSSYDAANNESLQSIQACATTTVVSIQSWAKTYGGNGSDYMKSIQQTSDGGYIVPGETYSFGQSHGDVWVLKLDSNGDIQWQKTYYLGTGYINPTSIQQTIDNGYVVAAYVDIINRRTDAWIIKLDSSGNIQWQKTYGGSYDDSIVSVKQTQDGGYIAVGDSYSFGAGNYDIWVLKLNLNGNIQWQKTYGSDGWDTGYYVDQTSDGGYILAGQTHSFAGGYPNTFNMWILRLDSNGGIQWERIYGSNWVSVNKIQQTTDSGFIISGTKPAGIGQYDIVVLKLDSSGNIQWQKAYGGTGYEYGGYVQQTSDGGYILAGTTSYSFTGSLDYWIAKLNSSGDIQWEKVYSTPYLPINDKAPFIYQTLDSGYILAGHTNSFGAGLVDLWILKLGTIGNVGLSCNLIGTANATAINTTIAPVSSSAIVKSSSATVTGTTAVPQNSNAAVAIQCSSQ